MIVFLSSLIMRGFLNFKIAIILSFPDFDVSFDLASSDN